MIDKQKDFLSELQALLQSYNIDAVYENNGNICFRSNLDTLAFARWQGETFESGEAVFYEQEYTP